jgi:hypothetical protein
MSNTIVETTSDKGLPYDPETGLPIGTIRKFDTGATRDTDEGKHDYEGYLSPAVLVEFAEYMTKHRRQSDGSLRESDNWQKGIPKDQYLKSLLRHAMDLWLIHRGLGHMAREGIKDALAGVFFNTQGYWHEHIKE